MKSKTSYYVFLMSLVLAIPLRIIQLAFAVDSETGFYKQGHFSIPLLTGVLVVSTVFLLLLAVLQKDAVPKVQQNMMFYLPSGLVSVAFAITTVYDMVAFEMPGYSESLDILSILLILLGAASAIYFAIIAFRYYSNQLNHSSLALFSLIPVLWSAARLIRAFMRLTTISNISEHLIDLLTMILMMLFLLSNARVLAKIKTKRAVLTILSLGFTAAVFGFISTIPRIIAMIIGFGYVKQSTILEHIVDLALAIYITFITVPMCFPKKQPVQDVFISK